MNIYTDTDFSPALRTRGPRIIAVGKNRNFPTLAETVAGNHWTQIGALSPSEASQPGADRLRVTLPAATS